MLTTAVVAMLFLVPASSLSQSGKSGITGVVEQMGRPGPSRRDDPPRLRDAAEVVVALQAAAERDVEAGGRLRSLLRRLGDDVCGER